MGARISRNNRPPPNGTIVLRLGECDVFARAFVLVLPLAEIRRLWGLGINYFANLLRILLLIYARAVIVLFHGVAFVVLSGHLAKRYKVNPESTADPKLTFHIDRASHLVNYPIANAEAQSCTSLIDVSVLLKLGEVHEQSLEALLADSFTVVDDLDREFIINQIFLTFDLIDH